MVPKHMRKAVYAFVALGLGGCAAPSGPRFVMSQQATAANMSRLVLYQDRGTVLLLENSKVLLDGKLVCSFGADQVMVKNVSPGEHTVSVDTPMTPGISALKFDAEPGKTTYISASPSGRRQAAFAFLGVIGFIGTALSANDTSPRGGELVLERESKQQAKKDTASMTVCDCAPKKDEPHS